MNSNDELDSVYAVFQRSGFLELLPKRMEPIQFLREIKPSNFSFIAPLGCSVFGCLVTYYLISNICEWSRRVRAPRVGKNPWFSGLARARADFFRNGRRLTEDGYNRYKDSIYWIQTGDMERLVLSNRYLNELRKLPDSCLDSRQAVVERNLGQYNRVDIILKSTAHVDVCRKQLVQSLGLSNWTPDSFLFD